MDNNAFEIMLRNTLEIGITLGEVEWAITDSQDGITNSNTIIYFRINIPDENGNIQYDNIDLTGLQPTKKTYYITAIYTNHCHNEQKIYTKELLFKEEHINMNAYIDNSSKHYLIQSESMRCMFFMLKKIYVIK